MINIINDNMRQIIKIKISIYTLVLKSNLQNIDKFLHVNMKVWTSCHVNLPVEIYKYHHPISYC